MADDDLNDETFGDLGDEDGALPSFFAAGGGGDLEFSSLMEDLKQSALLGLEESEGNGYSEIYGEPPLSTTLPDFFAAEVNAGRQQTASAQKSMAPSAAWGAIPKQYEKANHLNLNIDAQENSMYNMLGSDQEPLGSLDMQTGAVAFEMMRQLNIDGDSPPRRRPPPAAVTSLEEIEGRILAKTEKKQQPSQPPSIRQPPPQQQQVHHQQPQLPLPPQQQPGGPPGMHQHPAYNGQGPPRHPLPPPMLNSMQIMHIQHIQQQQQQQQRQGPMPRGLPPGHQPPPQGWQLQQGPPHLPLRGQQPGPPMMMGRPPPQFMHGPPPPHMVPPNPMQHMYMMQMQQHHLQQARLVEQHASMQLQAANHAAQGPGGRGPPQRIYQADNSFMYPRGEMMSGHDVKFVTTTMMRSLETSDPYNTDFYFHNFVRRKEERQRRTHATGQGWPADAPSPSLPPLALPVWQETKELTRKIAEEEQISRAQRTSEWQSENRVLGHTIRSDVQHPRAMLDINVLINGGQQQESSNIDDGDEVAADFGKPRPPFETQLWRARGCVQAATKALLKVQELRHFVALPSLPQQKYAEATRELEIVSGSLGKCLGLRPSPATTAAIEKARSNGEDGLEAAAVALESTLDLHLLSTLLEMTKGQRLMTRGMVLLSASERWSLLPAIMALLLARPPTTLPASAASGGAAGGKGGGMSDQQRGDAVEAEAALMICIREVVLTQRPAIPLRILSRCLELVMAAHRGRNSLIPNLSERTRALAMHAVLTRGKELAAGAPPQVAQDWTKVQTEFIAMATK